MALAGKPLFVYGTLRDPDVLEALLGRTLSTSERVDGYAPGFHAVHYPQRVYPALIALPNGNAPGLLLHNLTPTELAILDAFEGDEYRRASIAVLAPSGMVDADVYLPVISIPLDAEPWTLTTGRACINSPCWTANGAPPKPCAIGSAPPANPPPEVNFSGALDYLAPTGVWLPDNPAQKGFGHDQPS